MPLPSFRSSRSKVRRRRSHHALKPILIVTDKKTGEARLPHRAPPSAMKKVKKVEAIVEKAVEKKAEAKATKPKKTTKTKTAKAE
jgi:ribosomal protein L32